MEAILQQIANLSVIIYIVTTMLSMGLSFFPKQFVEPLKDKALILKSLAANFILVPLLTYLILQVIPLEQGLAIGLVLMATGAGSPFMLKLVQFTRARYGLCRGIDVNTVPGDSDLPTPYVVFPVTRGIHKSPVHSSFPVGLDIFTLSLWNGHKGPL